jgi:cathepsin B
MTYSSGVYKHVKGSFLGGHAVKVVGWGVDNGTPYWIAANSWTESWGDRGFFKIQEGECDFEAQFIAADPVL